ncbi:MAG: hypothetical protein WD379_05940 [Dehalococcoidia bacterium]
MSALALAVVALAACTGGGASNSGPSQSSASVDASCDALDEIESYRYTASLQLDVPSPSPTAAATPAASATADPLADVATALSELFRDYDLEGSFVAPDSSEVVIRPGDDEVAIRTIGEKSWIRAGTDPWQEQTPPDEDVAFTPQDICVEIVADLAPSLAAGSGSEETVNGIDTVHYELDQADLKSLPELLGRSGEEGLPNVFNVDVWLERDDGWPVRFHIVAADTGALGESISQELFLEFTDINDPNITIEPPPVSPAPT